MKKTMLTTAVLTAFILNASAQRTTGMTKNAPATTFGIHGGVNFFNITGKNGNGTDLNNDPVTGFSGGVNAEIPLGTGAYIQPGVDFARKGAENGNVKTILNYIDIPVNFIYKPVLGTGNLVLGLGPYLGIGMSGKIKYPNPGVGTGPSERNIVFTNEYDDSNPLTPQLKRLDAGANFLAGYELANKLSVNLKAQLGLKNIQPDYNNNNDEAKWNNTGFGLSLGYRF